MNFAKITKIFIFLTFVNYCYATQKTPIGIKVIWKPESKKSHRYNFYKKHELEVIKTSKIFNQDILKIESIKGKIDLHEFIKKVCSIMINKNIAQKCSPIYQIPINNSDVICKHSEVFTPQVFEQISKLFSEIQCGNFPSLSKTLPSRITSYKGINLTRYWAQEAIGAPEAKEFMDSLKNSLQTSSIGIIDGGFTRSGIKSLPRITSQIKTCITKFNDGCYPFFESHNLDYHGIAVAHLIAGKRDISSSYNGEISSIKQGGALNFTSTVEEILKEKKIPEVINISMGISDNQSEVIDKLSTKSVVVIAGGNSFPKRVDKVAFEQKVPKVIVGSIDHQGLVSDFSQADASVTITAPSDYSIMSIEKSGKIEVRFSGTSGAAPLVTGAISNVQSILPGITTEEIIKMLKETSIFALASEEHNRNGPGSLNAYKLVRVAARLKENWPLNREEILTNHKLYDFSTEAKENTANALKLLSELKENFNCKKLEEGFKLLRRAFFLDSYNPNARYELSSLYKIAGLFEQSIFYNDPVVEIQVPSIQKEVRIRRLFDLASIGNFDKVFKALDENKIKINEIYNGQKLYSLILATTDKLFRINQEFKSKFNMQKVFKKLLSYGMDLNYKDKVGEYISAYKYAFFNDDEDSLKKYISQGLKVSETVDYDSPLTLMAKIPEAFKKYHKLFNGHKVELNIPDSGGMNPVLSAVKEGNADFLEYYAMNSPLFTKDQSVYYYKGDELIKTTFYEFAKIKGFKKIIKLLDKKSS